jgi:tetratricopeptide (TPR) repeat protein
MPRTCFVICPIGESGSDTRKLADDVLELIIDPALESLGFEVIRADKMIGSTTITSEIINLVQNAELCIIDLTGHNANVFYECGRRHETARPFIQIIRKGEKPPFDVAVIRTIYYDLSNAREVRNTVLEMRQYAEAVVRDTSGMTRTSMSATSIADALDRIERKVDRLSSGQTPIKATKSSSAGRVGSRIRTVPLNQRYFQAVSQGDWETAANVVEQMREKDGLEPYVIAAALTVAAAGQSVGATIIYDALDSLPDWMAKEETGIGKNDALTSLAHYYIQRDDEVIGLAKLGETVSRLYNDNKETASAEELGRLANSLEQLAYGAQEYPIAIEWGERACKMQPQDETYWANLSMSYEGFDNLAKAKDAIDHALRDPLEDSTSHTLDQAIDVYTKLGDKQMVERLFAALEVVDSDRAGYKRFLNSLDEERG